MRIDNISKRIGHKDWNEIIRYWQNFLSSFTFPIDEIEIEDNLSIQFTQILDEINNSEKVSTDKCHYYQLKGIQYNIFAEAIYLFYKSMNSIKSAQVDQVEGYKTWSINNYYQSSYFSLKCFLNIMGVFYSCINNQYLIVDLFPTYKKITRRELSQRKSIFEIQVQKAYQLEHWENWKIFQRVISVARNLPIKEEVLDLLRLIDPKKFANQRNRIIYQNREWLFDDLRNELFDDAFGLTDILDEEHLSFNDFDDFTLLMSFTLFNINYILFHEISKVNQNFNAEFELFEKAISSKNNDHYRLFVEKNRISSIVV